MEACLEIKLVNMTMQLFFQENSVLYIQLIAVYAYIRIVIKYLRTVCLLKPVDSSSSSQDALT